MKHVGGAQVTTIVITGSSHFIKPMSSKRPALGQSPQELQLVTLPGEGPTQ